MEYDLGVRLDRIEQYLIVIAEKLEKISGFDEENQSVDEQKQISQQRNRVQKPVPVQKPKPVNQQKEQEFIDDDDDDFELE